MLIFKRVHVYLYFILLDGGSNDFIFYCRTNWLSILITYKKGPIITEITRKNITRVRV